MPLLRIDLQDGFRKDAVSIRVNHEEVFRRDALSTRLDIALADYLQLNVPDDRAHVEIKVATRNAGSGLDVVLPGSTYLAFSIDDAGQIRHKLSREPFRYK